MEILERERGAYLAPVEVIVFEILFVIGVGDIPLVLAEAICDFFDR